MAGAPVMARELRETERMTQKVLAAFRGGVLSPLQREKFESDQGVRQLPGQRELKRAKPRAPVIAAVARRGKM